jgi:hypothetical protein
MLSPDVAISPENEKIPGVDDRMKKTATVITITSNSAWFGMGSGAGNAQRRVCRVWKTAEVWSLTEEPELAILRWRMTLSRRRQVEIVPLNPALILFLESGVFRSWKPEGGNFRGAFITLITFCQEKKLTN